MSSIHDQLVKHLDDAYGMELNVLRMLDGMIATTDAPRLLDALERHREQTKAHATWVRSRLDAHGETPSMVAELTGIATALAKLPLDLVRGARAGRNARDCYAAEHLEIATYELLKLVAQRAGDEETVATCTRIAAEERWMAQEIADAWPAIVDASLRSEGASVI